MVPGGRPSLLLPVLSRRLLTRLLVLLIVELSGSGVGVVAISLGWTVTSFGVFRLIVN